MPTYEYRCKSCDHTFDIVQSFRDDPLTECPACGEATLKQVFGNVGIAFKGSGFYKTDSRSAGSFGSTKDADRSDTASSSSAKESGKDAKASSGSKDSASSASSSNGSSGSSSGTSSSTAKSA